MDGFRHHVARFASRRSVDIHNTEEFVRPVRLHRRDPRAPPAGAGIKGEDVSMTGIDPVDDKQKEKEEMIRAEKEAAKEAEAALVAPAVNNSGQKRLGGNMKKTEQVYRNDQTDEQRARSKLRYEEALPWHLEDFDNKSTWTGGYEAALSDTYAMMVQGQDGTFRVLPLEKWYKFTQKNQFKTLSIEEAETRYNRKVKEPRWFMDSEDAKKKRQVEQDFKKVGSGLFLGKWEKGSGRGGDSAPVTKNENVDADDLDFTEDRFADDEENMLFEEDDETKEAEERIKRDQLQANIFGLKEEKEYDKQEQLERKERDEEKKLGKRVKKALMKREKNYIYDSDSTDNPYSSEVSICRLVDADRTNDLCRASRIQQRQSVRKILKNQNLRTKAPPRSRLLNPSTLPARVHLLEALTRPIIVSLNILHHIRSLVLHPRPVSSVQAHLWHQMRAATSLRHARNPKRSMLSLRHLHRQISSPCLGRPRPRSLLHRRKSVKLPLVLSLQNAPMAALAMQAQAVIAKEPMLLLVVRCLMALASAFASNSILRSNTHAQDLQKAAVLTALTLQGT